MIILGEGIRVEYAPNAPVVTKPGRMRPAHKMRRIKTMFSKSKPKRMLEARFDASIKEGCCCYLCEKHKNLN